MHKNIYYSTVIVHNGFNSGEIRNGNMAFNKIRNLKV